MASPMFLPLFHASSFTSSSKDSHTALPPVTGPLSTLLSRLAASRICPAARHSSVHSCHHHENALQISKINMGPDGRVLYAGPTHIQCHKYAEFSFVIIRIYWVSAVGVTIRNSSGRNPSNLNFLILVLEKNQLEGEYM